MSNIKNASIIVVTGRNYDRVLMVRDKKNLQWMFPGGKIDRNETPWQAAKREFREETGFDLPHLEGDSNGLYEYIRSHRNGTQTKIYLGFMPFLDREKLHEKYKPNLVKNGETDKAYSVCFSSLVGYWFSDWRSSTHTGKQIVRPAEELSLQKMYRLRDPIGIILRQTKQRADDGCGGGAQKQPQKAVQQKAVQLIKPKQPATKCSIGGRKKPRRRKTRRGNIRRRKNKKRKKTRRRKHG
jgi:8-oxo-dGTP pyrophosphatase MutT (NUDIX family)